MKRRILFFWLIVLSTFIGHNASAQLVKHEAAYIFNFTRFIKWPESGTQDNFIIGVLGENEELAAELKNSAANRTVGSKPIKVVEFASIEQISNCQILFVPNKKTGSLKRISEHLSKQPTVIISEKMEWNPKESTINLHLIDQKLAFYINQKNAKSKGIVVSEKLLGLSR